MKIIVIIALLLFNFHPYQLLGQKDSLDKSPFSLSGYLDFYYAYEFNKPARERALLANNSSHVFSHHRHNEMSVNNAIIFLKYNGEKTRGALSLHAGTYVNANYSKELGVLKNIYEAYAGFKLGKYIWLDAGIFTSHIGVESAISMDNYTLSRSIMAENTPYYESGVKASYSNSERLTFTILLLNGWQNISENNQNKAVGTQLQLKPVKNILLNSSTFIGKEAPAFDTISTMRYFHNFYSEIVLKNLSIITGFDVGLQEKRNGANIWYNPLLILRFNIRPHLLVAARAEFYNDRKGVIINPGTPYGFQVFSPSLNIDFKIGENLLWRIEGRLFNAKYPIYIKDQKIVKSNIFILTSLSFRMK